MTMGHPRCFSRLPVVIWIIFPIVFFLAFISFGHSPMVTYAMELKPVIYVFTAWLWSITFGTPTKRAFVQAGIALCALIIAELFIGSIIQRSLVRPVGSGEVNYDACLIVLSLCVALSDPVCSGQDIFLLFGGVLATFSRTGGMAALAVLLLSRRVPKLLKLGAVGASLAVSIVSFLIRNLQLDINQIDRYLMWASALDLFHSDPKGLVWGYGVGAALPATGSAGLADLWITQAEKLDVSGIYAFQYHALWLRLLISWGSVTTGLLLLTLLAWVLQRKSLLARFLATVILLEGLSMGVIYLSNIGVPVWLLIILVEREIHPSRLDHAETSQLTTSFIP
ncbi:MAG TPA: hypothetical protein VN682_15500 [Terriglobales bacterium]|nr:hypothetical protein [Terriglobales bacterium]